MNWPEINIKKTRFSDPVEVRFSGYRERRQSYSNDRMLNPSISGAEQDSVCSTKGIHHAVPAYLNQRLEDLSVDSSQGTVICKPITSKLSSITKTSRSSLAKASATAKRKTEPTKNRDSVSSLEFFSFLPFPCLFFSQTRVQHIPRDC